MATIHYYDIGDYKTREEKLAALRTFRSIENVPWTIITPNEKGDWINQRNDEFDTLVPLSEIFTLRSNGLKTGRDIWCYSFSLKKLTENMKRMIAFYNEQTKAFHEQKKWDSSVNADDFINYDKTKISWDRELQNRVKHHTPISFQYAALTTVMYRPFCKMRAYFDRDVNQRTYQMPRLFPRTEPDALCSYDNSVICIPASGRFSCLMTDTLTDLGFIGATQCFPYWVYEKSRQATDGKYQDLLPANDSGLTERRENITDAAMTMFRDKYHQNEITKRDIFYYIYGILHSPVYRQRFQNELKKQLPRIPLVKDYATFRQFSAAGKRLAELHVNYESGESSKLSVESKSNHSPLKPNQYSVRKMRFPSKTDKSQIIYNGEITLSGIPLSAYDYVVNGRSAVEWVMERYQVKTDKDSGIVNDPNDWLREQENPRYIIELLQRVVYLSVESVKIIASLPEIF